MGRIQKGCGVGIQRPLAVVGHGSVDVPEGLAVVIRIHEHGGPHLAEVAYALGRFGPILGRTQCREQHRRQNRDDGDHDKQFDQCEPPGPPTPAVFRQPVISCFLVHSMNNDVDSPSFPHRVSTGFSFHHSFRSKLAVNPPFPLPMIVPAPRFNRACSI